MKCCSKCHLAKPLTEFGADKRNRSGKTARCKICLCLQTATFKKMNRADTNMRSRKWRALHRERALASARAWRVANKDAVSKYRKEYRLKNPGHAAQCTLRYRLRYPHKVRASANARKKRVLLQTPVWARTGLIMRTMKDIYGRTPPGHHVDHIIPLRGKTVSGLHVPWNLQYLEAQENRRKINRFEGDNVAQCTG